MIERPGIKTSTLATWGGMLFLVAGSLLAWRVVKEKRVLLEAYSADTWITIEAQTAATLLGFLGFFLIAGVVLLFVVLAQQRRLRSLVEQTVAARAQADRAHAQLLDAIKSVSQAVILYDADDKIVLFNERCFEFIPESRDVIRVGQDYETAMRILVGRGAFVLDGTPPEDFIAQRIEKHRGTDTSSFESRTKDGRFVQVTKARTSEGGVIAITTDVTDLILRERERRQTEERYRRLVEVCPDGIYIVRDGLIALVNPAAARALGAASAEDLLGRPVLGIVHPDQRGSVEALVRRIVTEGFHSLSNERRYVGLDGRVFPVEVSGIPIVHDGRPAVLEIFRDITERKKAEAALGASERRFRDFAESAADWFWETDASLRFTYLSPNVERICGVPPEAHYGRTREEILGGAIEPDIWDAHRETLRRREPFRDFVYPREAKDMPVRWLRVSGVPYFGNDGEFLGYRGSASDVTAQREAEQTLKELDEQVRLIADHAPLFISYVTAERRFGFINKTAQRWLQRSASDVMGLKRDEVMTDNSLEVTEPAIDSVLGGETSRLEGFVSYPDGVERWVEVIYVPHVDATGRVRGYFSLAQDLTERKRAEREASEARQTLIEAVQSTDHGIAICDGADRLVIWNDAFSDLNIAVRDRLEAGIYFPDLIRYAAEAGQVLDAVGNEEAWIEERQSNRGGYETAVRRIADGRWFSVTERRMPSGGIVGVWTDVTELKAREAELEESEKQIRLITDNLPVSISYADSQLRFRFVNRTACQWMKMVPSDFVGRPLVEVIDEQRFRRIKPYLDRALGGETAHFEQKVRYPDGIDRFVQATYIPHRDENGEVCGVFGLVFDSTDYHQAQELLIQAQKMEAVGHLTGGIAHDFNNLLLAILGNLELIEQRLEGDEAAQRYLGTALRATHRGANLTQRLLAFSRKQALRPDVVDVNKLVWGMVELMQRTLGEDVEIRTRLTASCRRAIVDAHQLENALLNLALNARDAMRDGGPLTVETSNVELAADYFTSQESVEPGDYVMVAVSDCGTGMSREVLERAFEPFFTTKDVGAGSGLGLSMVYGFVKQSGGHVTIYSEPGVGTTVKLFLPGAKAEEEVSEIPTAQEMPIGTETILLVEDDTAVRAYVKESLSELGYRVYDAVDGPDAVGQLRGLDHLDLLLTDLVLPQGMDGRDVAAAVSDRFPNVPCLFASGYADRGLVRDGRVEDGIELLEKPFTRLTLAQRVRALLDETARDDVRHRHRA